MAILTAGYVFTMFTVNVISGSKFVLVETDDNGIGRSNCKKSECKYKGECYPKYFDAGFKDKNRPGLNRKYCGTEKCLPLTSMCRKKWSVSDNPDGRIIWGGKFYNDT